MAPGERLLATKVVRHGWLQIGWREVTARDQGHWSRDVGREMTGLVTSYCRNL